MSQPERDKVLDVLGSIIEPDLKKDIVSANLVEELHISDTEISITVQIVNPAMHARKRMRAESIADSLHSCAHYIT